MYQKVNLPKRQAQVLFHVLKGKSAKSIAKEMSTSYRTIEYYTEILKNKFNCRTKNELIETAFNHGFAAITPQKDRALIVKNE